MYWSLRLIIVLYIVVGQIVIQMKYLQLAEPIGVIRMSALAVGELWH
jgi:hypothetical protein